MRNKIYLHYEPTSGPACTLSFPVEPDTLLLTIVQSFLNNFRSQLPTEHSNVVANYLIKTEEGKEIKVASKSLVEDVLEEEESDLFLFPIAKPQQPATVTAASPQPVAQSKPVATTKVEPSKSSSSKNTESPTSSSTTFVLTVVHRDILKLQEKMNNKQYRAAKQVCEQYLFKTSSSAATPSTTTSPNNTALAVQGITLDVLIDTNYLYILKCYLEIHLFTQRYHEILKYQKLFLFQQIYLKMDGKIVITIQYFFSRANYEIGNYPRAIEWIDKALDIWKWLYPSAQMNNHSIYLNFIALKAHCRFQLGEHQEAADLLNGIMEYPLADNHLGILYAYGLLTSQYHKYAETIIAILKLIALIGIAPKINTHDPATCTAAGANGMIGGVNGSGNNVTNTLLHTQQNTKIRIITTNNNPTTTTNQQLVKGEKNKDIGKSTAILNGLPRAQAITFPSTPIHPTTFLPLPASATTFTTLASLNPTTPPPVPSMINYYQDYYHVMLEQHHTKLIKQFITQFLALPAGLDQLLKKFPTHYSRGTYEIYSYLANMVKEYSAIALSIKLYEMILPVSIVNNAHSILQLIHLYEIWYDYELVLDIIYKFDANNLKLAVGKDLVGMYASSTHHMKGYCHNVHLVWEEITRFWKAKKQEGEARKMLNEGEKGSETEEEQDEEEEEGYELLSLGYGITLTRLLRQDDVSLSWLLPPTPPASTVSSPTALTTTSTSTTSNGNGSATMPGNLFGMYCCADIIHLRKLHDNDYYRYHRSQHDQHLATGRSSPSAAPSSSPSPSPSTNTSSVTTSTSSSSGGVNSPMGKLGKGNPTPNGSSPGVQGSVVHVINKLSQQNPPVGGPVTAAAAAPSKPTRSSPSAVISPAPVTASPSSHPAILVEEMEEEKPLERVYYHVVWHAGSSAGLSSSSYEHHSNVDQGFATVSKLVLSPVVAPMTISSSSSVVTKSLETLSLQDASPVDDHDAEESTVLTLPKDDVNAQSMELRYCPIPLPTQSFVPAVYHSERELHWIALLVMIVKSHYLQGNLLAIPYYLSMIETIRRTTKLFFHETMIRNEMAYYVAIVQLIAIRHQVGYSYCYEEHVLLPPSAAPAAPSVPGANSAVQTVATEGLSSTYTLRYENPATSMHPLYQQARASPLYLCGDSHILSPAWQCIIHKRQLRMLIPKLVTGVKQYHLRKESLFYTKEQFLQAMKLIPVGSEVIMVVGEIDCREGILLAVEQDKYGSIEEGMLAVMKPFLQLLQHFQREKHFHFYIHPIPPVLNETRALVLTFNRLYQQEIQALQDPHIQWLDFYERLLDPAPGSTPNALSHQRKLKAQYHLDGTHLHPRYVKLLENSLNFL